jgi:hypothetical protein
MLKFLNLWACPHELPPHQYEPARGGSLAAAVDGTFAGDLDQSTNMQL